MNDARSGTRDQAGAGAADGADRHTADRDGADGDGADRAATDASADDAPDAPVLAEGLSKRYGDVLALDDVSLAVQRGEVLALVGPNGAGKTTLVRCLTGTVAPDDGRARLLGAVPTDADRERVGLLPQSYAPPGRLTARELLSFYAGLYDDPRDPADALAAVGLDGPAAETWYEQLSGGQQRRACVAAALVNDPEVLFLDEPTTGIDPEGRRAVWGVLQDLVDAGTTLVVTTHDMTEAARLADRVAVLAGGELLAVETPDALVAAHGGESTLRVAVAGGHPSTAPLAELPVDATVEDGELVVRCGPDEVAAVVRALDEAGVTFEAIEWREPTLEDVYVSLAGTGSATDERPADRRDGSVSAATAVPDGRAGDRS